MALCSGGGGAGPSIATGEDYSTGSVVPRMRIPGTRVAPPSPVMMPMSAILMVADDEAKGRHGLASRGTGDQFERVAARRKAAVEEHVRLCRRALADRETCLSRNTCVLSAIDNAGAGRRWCGRSERGGGGRGNFSASRQCAFL